MHKIAGLAAKRKEKKEIAPEDDPLLKFRVAFKAEEFENQNWDYLKDMTMEIIRSFNRFQLQLTGMQTSVFKAHEGLQK